MSDEELNLTIINASKSCEKNHQTRWTFPPVFHPKIFSPKTFPTCKVVAIHLAIHLSTSSSELLSQDFILTWLREPFWCFLVTFALSLTSIIHGNFCREKYFFHFSCERRCFHAKITQNNIRDVKCYLSRMFVYYFLVTSQKDEHRENIEAIRRSTVNQLFVRSRKSIISNIFASPSCFQRGHQLASVCVQ